MTQRRPDVIVVGGGIVGAASAYYLAKRGFGVTLLEARDLAYGASGRNLGFVWLHTRRPGPELDLALTSRRLLADWPEELDFDFELSCHGGMIFFQSEEQARVMAEFVRRRRADGVEMRLVDAREARELAPLLPEGTQGASYCPLDAQVNPALYVRAFATAAQRLGAEVRVGEPVRRLIVQNGRVAGVEIDGGAISAGTTVLAAGAWTPELARSLGLEVPIHPMRLQIVSTAPLPRMLDRPVYGAVAVKQYRVFQELPGFDAKAFEADYEQEYEMPLLQAICQTRGGHFLLGCSMDYPGFVWEPDLRGIALITGAMLRDLPALRQARFDRAWAGILPYTLDNYPIIDFVPGYEGLMVAAGHVFGNAAGPTTGLLVSEMVARAQTTIDVTPFRFDRPSLTGAAAASTW
ncbi:MAG: FAD-binding oxidoreductase [Candidatus Rokubacteria bacterium]|nr:FAD-binding oxidoreductase [Candidatus Rokubacteria bacterium]